MIKFYYIAIFFPETLDGNNIFHGLAVEVKKVFYSIFFFNSSYSEFQTPFHLDGAETVLNKARQILGEHLQIPDDSTKDKLQKSLKGYSFSNALCFLHWEI